MNSTFSYSVLQHIEKVDTKKVTNMSQCFDTCRFLMDVPAFEIPLITSTSGIYNCFKNCSYLTNESLNNIMAMCLSAINISGTKTLKYLGLSSTQATTCQSLSNYQAFLDAGWTTGY